MGQNTNNERKIRITVIILICVFSIVTIGLTAWLILSSGEEDPVYMASAVVLDATEPIPSGTSVMMNPDREMRGVWIASVMNINFPSRSGLGAEQLKEELDEIVAVTKKAGLNAIYFQVRPSADALYQSQIFPTSRYLTGVQGAELKGALDPLSYIIEKAHAEGIAVHAWINPLRVTVGSASSPQYDVSTLADGHPARENPDWVIPYADGRLYFDSGNPDVRTLIAAGVKEIVDNYQVDGIIFDDYFYPYPVTVTDENGKNVEAVFDDSVSFEKYNPEGLSLGDWRRSNINQMVKACYDAVKSSNSYVRFGVAPFGIWKNDDGKNGGSDTRGLSSYSAIYCDPLAWIEGGYIDYIAPQIYWQFNFSVARFDVLMKWWNAAVDGSNVDLYISQAAYRVEEFDTEEEITNQLVFARSELNYKGSIFYGYEQIRENACNLSDQLAACYQYEISYVDVSGNGMPVHISSPANGSYVNEASTYLIGSSDPEFPLYFEGKPVSRTRLGYFSLYVDLKNGENTFTFTQNGVETNYTVIRGTREETPYSYTQWDRYCVNLIQPEDNIMLAPGESFTVRVEAPSGSKVTVTLDAQSITLKPLLYPPSEGKYMREVYTGVLTLPQVEEGVIQELGNLKVLAVRDGESASAEGVCVRVIGEGAAVRVEVTAEETFLKTAVDSWYYDDFVPAVKGMTDLAVSQKDGYYNLRMGGYISDRDCMEVTDDHPDWNRVSSVSGVRVETDDTYVYIKVGVTSKVPLHAYLESNEQGDYFVFVLYNTFLGGSGNVAVPKNNLLKDGISSYEKGITTYRFRLVNRENFYGFELYYEEGYVVARLRNPSSLYEGDKPFEGKTFILDAGHGGTDGGAAGPDEAWSEADLSLSLTLAVAAQLEKMGATIVLTRESDATVDIYSRMDMLDEICPDLCLSIHYNSMGYASDITKIRGLVALYWADSGKLLATSISSALSEALGRYEREVTSQQLAMLRNRKFPAALIEVGFMTCVEEYDQSLQEGYLNLASEAIVEGLLEYYVAQEKYIN